MNSTGSRLKKLRESFIKRPRLWAFLFALAIALATIPRAAKLKSPDFEVFYVAGRHALTAPENIYKITPQRYLYPPAAAVLLTPFSFTQYYPLHQWMWHALLAGIVWALAGKSAAALASMALLSRYLAITFGYGQINLVIIGLMAGAGAWLFKHPGRAGALWAISVFLKVYPIVFFPAFLPPRLRKGILWAAITAVVLTILPLLLYGPTLGIQLYREFFQALDSRGAPTHSHNQSITALFLRLFTDQPFHLHAIEDIQWTIASFPPVLVQIASLGLGILLTAISWLKALRTPLDSARFLSAAAFSILFLSHIVWKDYLLFVFFPLYEVFRTAPKNRSLILAGLYFSLVTFTSYDIVGSAISTRLDAACIHLWGAILIWIFWLN